MLSWSRVAPLRAILDLTPQTKKHNKDDVNCGNTNEMKI